MSLLNNFYCSYKHVLEVQAKFRLRCSKDQSGTLHRIHIYIYIYIYTDCTAVIKSNHARMAIKTLETMEDK